MNDFYVVILLFLLISILYSSVGFGGGSSYLAVLALTALPFLSIKSTALVCNIIVVFGNLYMYQKDKLLKYKKIIPLVLLSVPMAFIGGYLKIKEEHFYILLGFTLLFAAISMWFSKKIESKSVYFEKKSGLKNVILGGLIGFISGLVGIGGGIFLAPILHLSNWDVPKKIAATSSFFILINSLSGLIGQSISFSKSIDYTLIFSLGLTVFIGGQIGSRLSLKLLSPIQLKKATALLIIFVSIRILYSNLIN